MTRKRRFHPAPAGRVMATGLSLSATLGIMAVLAANQPQWSTTTVAAGGAGSTPGTPNTTLVTDVVPRTIVLQPGQTPPGAGTPGPTDPAAAPADSGGAPAYQSGGAPADQSGSFVPVDSGAPAPAPVDSGAAAPAPAPQPVATQPPVTQPPVTAPPPPACSGSQCP
jgi:hypothetical protein